MSQVQVNGLLDDQILGIISVRNDGRARVQHLYIGSTLN